MNFQKELYDKYPIDHYIVEIDGVELHQFYTPEYKIDDILFVKNDNNGTYEPRVYDYSYDKNTDEHSGIDIVEGGVIFEYVRAVKNVLKKTDVAKNTVTEGSLYLFQWASSINIILESQRYNSKEHDLERSRQVKLF